jgi:hypothetical protein
VLDLVGAQADDLGPVALAPDDGLHELAREVPVGHLEAMRVHDPDARPQGSLQRGQLALDVGLRRPIAFTVDLVARDDLGALGLDAVGDDDLADVLGAARDVVGDVDFVASGGAQDQERGAVIAGHAHDGVVGFEGRAALRAGKDDGERTRRSLVVFRGRAASGRRRHGGRILPEPPPGSAAGLSGRW